MLLPPPVMVVLVTLEILPLASTTNTGTCVALPYVPNVTPVVDNVAPKLPVPLPVTSPVSVIV